MARRIKRGGVYWIDLKPKRRPGLVLTRDRIIPELNHVTLVPSTRTNRKIPTQVEIGLTEEMPEECVFNCDHIVTIPKTKVGGLITELDEHTIKAVKRALLFALGWSYEH